MIDSLHTEIIASSVVLLVTVLLGGDQALSILEESHNITRSKDGEIQIAPYWDLADEVATRLASLIAPVARLGFVTLDETTLASNALFAHLLSLGIRSEAFVSLA